MSQMHDASKAGYFAFSAQPQLSERVLGAFARFFRNS